MFRLKAKTYILGLLMAFTLSCDSDDVVISEVSGTIVDGASRAGLENCRFLVQIDGTLYQPTYLNFEYEQDGLEVLMKVEFLETFADCSQLALPPARIRIEQIRPAN